MAVSRVLADLASFGLYIAAYVVVGTVLGLLFFAAVDAFGWQLWLVAIGWLGLMLVLLVCVWIVAAVRSRTG